MRSFRVRQFTWHASSPLGTTSFAGSPAGRRRRPTDADASLSLGDSGGPPLVPGLSPTTLSPGGHVVPQPRSRQRLSPLDTSVASIDEPMSASMSPGGLAREMQGFDLAESVERP